MKKLTAFFVTIITMAAMTAVAAYAESFEDKIITSVQAHQTTIDISKYNMNPTEALNNVLELKNTAPELWAIDEKINLKGDTKKAYQIIVTYDYSEKEISDIEKKMNKTIAEAIEMVDKSASIYEQAKAVYKYMLDAYDYDYSLTKHKEYELFETGSGVCSAYSLAFKDIMQELGIPCKAVVSKEMKHQWNVIEINGKWYNVDASYGDMYRTGSDDYSAFCKSDFFFQLLGFYGGHIEGNTYCTDRGYDYDI